MIGSRSLQAEGLNHRSRGQRPRNTATLSHSRPVGALQPLLCAFVDIRRSGKIGRNCETNPISFKTYYPPNTNNEEISFLLKSKPYGGVTTSQQVKASQAESRSVKASQGTSEKNYFPVPFVPLFLCGSTIRVFGFSLAQ
jgi:hypothetical protein